MSDKELNVEDIINESLNRVAEDVNKIVDIDELKFKDIKARLEKEIELIEEAKRIDISVSIEDRDASIKEINDNPNLTHEQKEEEIAKINEIYETGIKFVAGNQIEALNYILNKTRELMDEMQEKLNKEISDLDFNDTFKEDYKNYNENVEAISYFSQKYGNGDLDYKKYDVDVNKLIEDSELLNDFTSNLNKTEINYENLDGKIDTINELLDRNPNSYRVIDTAQTFTSIGLNVLEEKQNELLNAHRELNITKEESRIYDSSTSDQEFVDTMLKNDDQAQKIVTEIENIDNEIEALKEELNVLNKDSEEYAQVESQIESKTNLLDDLNNNYNNIKEEYVNRKIQLNKFDQKYGKDIEKYNELLTKLNALDKRSRAMLHTYNYKKNQSKNQVKENEVESEEVEQPVNEEKIVKENEEQTPEENKDPKGNNENKNDKKQGEKSKENTITTSKNKDLKVVSEPQNAKNTVDNFLKLSLTERAAFLQNKDGYSKLNDAIETLDNNKEGYSIPRKDRKQLLDSLNSTMKVALKEEALNESKEGLLNLLSRLNGGNTKESSKLFNELFTYNKATKMPFISAGLIEKNDQHKLAGMIHEYTSLLKDGQISEEEMENFERFVINPLIANSIKQNIADMGFLGKLKNKFNGNKLKPFHALNSSIKDFSEVKCQINFGKYLSGDMNLQDSVYSGKEVTMNELERIINEDMEQNSQQKSQGVR